MVGWVEHKVIIANTGVRSSERSSNAGVFIRFDHTMTRKRSWAAGPTHEDAALSAQSRPYLVVPLCLRVRISGATPPV
jgi:hypothetical protein